MKSGHDEKRNEKEPVLLIHGGAGTIRKNVTDPMKQKKYHDALCEALKIGSAILTSGGTAVEAVVGAVKWMEDCPLFNAGKGSVFTSDGSIEMDACLMDGRDRSVGAVSCVSTIKNPILAAKSIKEGNEFVFLAGAGAEKYCFGRGLEKADRDYFFVQDRFKQWEAINPTGKMALDHDCQTEDELSYDTKTSTKGTTGEDGKYGTVGAVALDALGDLAAATSTGGLTNKQPGRVGDTPIVGAGTYAQNGVCAVSGTGQGEFFIRSMASSSVAQWVRTGVSVEEAVKKVIFGDLAGFGAIGGLIAVDSKGNVSADFNSIGMYHGLFKGGNIHTAIFKGENKLH